MIALYHNASGLPERHGHNVRNLLGLANDDLFLAKADTKRQQAKVDLVQSLVLPLRDGASDGDASKPRAVKNQV